MRVRVLGCSGGIGPGLRTTSMMINHDTLIDAGSGLGELSIDEMAQVKRIFLTHSHLDHIAFIPFLLDAIFERIGEPLVIYGLESTLMALQSHIFNWVVWPDFSKLPSESAPVMRYHVIKPGQVIREGGVDVEVIPVSHTVPAVGYRISSGEGALAFSGDTATNESFWRALNAHDRLDLLFIETAFANRQKELAGLAKHYCPETLATDLSKLNSKPRVYLTHLKPGEEKTILSEARALNPDVQIKALVAGEVFQL